MVKDTGCYLWQVLSVVRVANKKARACHTEKTFSGFLSHCVLKESALGCQTVPKRGKKQKENQQHTWSCKLLFLSHASSWGWSQLEPMTDTDLWSFSMYVFFSQSPGILPWSIVNRKRSSKIWLRYIFKVHSISLTYDTFTSRNNKELAQWPKLLFALLFPACTYTQGLCRLDTLSLWATFQSAACFTCYCIHRRKWNKAKHLS